jgi:DNA-binding beta-propeller fold protein YncE
MQGIDWAIFETYHAGVKTIRRRYHEHPHIRPYPPSSRARWLREAEQIFSFQQTNTIARPWIEHYQLRNLVATTSANDVHYVSRSKVMSVGPSAIQPICIMDLNTSSNPRNDASDFHITALAAVGTALVAGGFRGQYAIQDLLSEFGTEPTTGYVSNQVTAITNHLHGIHSRSSGYPLAVFCSNDHHLRTLDIHTGRIVTSVRYDDIMNCAATSPNGRLRVLAGDFEGALITDADSGRILERVHGGSSGHGFACAWADNDIQAATAGQDCQVLVWDARNWSTPLAAIATENTHPTSLQFSPVGGGSPVLVVAEAADTVSIVDARSYTARQTIDLFGDIAGTAISSDGAQLIIANGDRYLGGLMTFQRHDFGASEELFDRRYSGGSGEYQRRRSPQERSDWLPECELDSHPRVRLDAKARRRRGLRLDDMLF